MKVNNTVRQIFAHAVAMDQSGGMRNTVYCIGKEIYILNYDHTVLLRFRVRKSEANFDTPISFRANDYDSDKFYEKDGKIVFESEQNGYTRRKSCGTPDNSPEEVKELFGEYDTETDRETVELTKQVVGLLEEDLSHIEFYGTEGGNLTMVQRNIYSGATVEVEKQGGLFDATLNTGFGPIAVKTSDFMALYSFQDSLQFHFPKNEGDENFLVIESINQQKFDMKGFIACCLYDEVIQVKESKQGKQNKEESKNGRKKQKVRRSK